MKTITVQGMHCDACKKLIMMELEDAQLDQLVGNIDVDAGSKQGVLTVQDSATDDNIAKIKRLINDMEGYTTL